MTFTNDERSEVANSLRFRAVWVDFPYPIKYAQNSFWIEHTLREIVDAIGCAGNQYPAQWLVRLADLIDPTCDMEDAGDVPASVKDNLRTFFCSECGSPVYNDMTPSYCPYCGARVMCE